MIAIRLMQKEEREKVSLFVGEVMRKEYECDTHALPEEVFIACSESGLVGTMAFSMSEGDPFPMEKIYALDYSTFPDSFERIRIVQLGRWVATMPDVSLFLLSAVMRYAASKDRIWGIGEVKPKVARRYRQAGFSLVRLRGDPIFANIPPGILPYYTTPPSPIPCALFLPHAEKILSAKLSGKISRNVMISL